MGIPELGFPRELHFSNRGREVVRIPISREHDVLIFDEQEEWLIKLSLYPEDSVRGARTYITDEADGPRKEICCFTIEPNPLVALAVIIEWIKEVTPGGNYATTEETTALP